MDLYSPRIGSRNAKNADYFKQSIDKEMNRLLEVYEENAPVNDPALMNQVKEILVKAGADMTKVEKGL